MKKIIIALAFYCLIGLFFTSNINASGTFQCELKNINGTDTCSLAPDSTCDASTPIAAISDTTNIQTGLKTCGDFTPMSCPIFNKFPCLAQNSTNINSTPIPSINTSGGTMPLINVNTLLGSMTGFKFTGASGNFGGIISALLPYFYAFAGVGLLVFLIIGGFKYMTSSGDPKKTESAKGTITAAVIGFVLIIVAYWLTQIVNYVFGLGVNVP